jgi:hypothetical protein
VKKQPEKKISEEKIEQPEKTPKIEFMIAPERIGSPMDVTNMPKMVRESMVCLEHFQKDWYTEIAENSKPDQFLRKSDLDAPDGIWITMNNCFYTTMSLKDAMNKYDFVTFDDKFTVDTMTDYFHDDVDDPLWYKKKCAGMDEPIVGSRSDEDFQHYRRCVDLNSFYEDLCLVFVPLKSELVRKQAPFFFKIDSRLFNELNFYNPRDSQRGDVLCCMTFCKCDFHDHSL